MCSVTGHTQVDRNSTNRMTSPLLRAVGWYTGLLERRPIATKSVTAAVIAAVGDAACQYLQLKREGQEESSSQDSAKRKRPAYLSLGGMLTLPLPSLVSQWDATRTARMGLYALGITPGVHHWYNALNRAFPTSPMKRMLSDQLAWTPATLVLFLLSMGLAEHGSVAAAAHKLRCCFWSILKSNYVLWPAVQYVNLGFVPPKFQILVANIVGLAWAVYLSSVVNAGGAGGGGGGGTAAEAVEDVRKERREMAAESILTKASALPYLQHLQQQKGGFISGGRAVTLSPSFGAQSAAAAVMTGDTMRYYAPKTSPAAAASADDGHAQANLNVNRQHARQRGHQFVPRFFARSPVAAAAAQEPAIPYQTYSNLLNTRGHSGGSGGRGTVIEMPPSRRNTLDAAQTRNGRPSPRSTRGALSWDPERGIEV